MSYKDVFKKDKLVNFYLLIKELFSGDVFFTTVQSNKYNTFTAVFISMANTQNLKVIQRSKKGLL